MICCIQCVAGVVGLLWFAVWWWVIYPSPEVHKTISNAEKSYIMDSLAMKKGEKVRSMISQGQIV